MKKNDCCGNGWMMVAVVFMIAMVLIPALPAKAEPPYPVVFVHGLFGNQASWTVPRLDMIDEGVVSREVIVHFSANADQNIGSSNVATDTAFVAWSTRALEPITPNGDDRLFTVNFDRRGFPSFAGHANDEYSNTASIMKTGAALGSIIDRILAIPGMPDKVILVGHSMGGLTIREYLQRTDGNGNHRWWDDNVGHRVASVATLVTPHHGSMLLAYVGFEPNDIDESWFDVRASEATRDLRTWHYTGLFNTEHDGVYLYGGSEDVASGWGFLSYWNKDVNCDGNESGTAVGVSYANSGADAYTDNPAMPLPTDIPYRWLTSVSETNPPGDGVVELWSQWLHQNGVAVPATADTVRADVPHMPVHDDLRAVYRGMDEPDEEEFAYEIQLDMGIDRWLSGRITWAPNYDPNLPVAPDVDQYWFRADRTTDATLRLSGWEWSDTWAIDVINIGTGQPIIPAITAQNNPGQDDVTLPLVAGEDYRVTISAEAIRAKGNTYFFAIDTHPVLLTATPQNAPVEIPANGGSFSFDINAGSLTGSEITGDLWAMATLPNGSTYGPAFLDEDITLPASGSVQMTMQQFVPAGAPAGSYSYTVSFGSFPNGAVARDEFMFTKIATLANGPAVTDWDVRLIDTFIADASQPESPLLVSAYPNPFNAATTITVQLQSASELTVRVYDLLGRQVRELAHGPYGSGQHQFTVDGSNLASGVYFLRATAGTETEMRKLVLMK